MGRRVTNPAGGAYDFSLSVRHVAEVVMDSFCPRCYWLQHRLGFKPPFALPFPGVFQVLDGVSKNVCYRLLDQLGRLPVPYRCPDAVSAIAGLSWQNFGFTYPVSTPSGHTYSVRVQGVPDLVVRKTTKKLACFDNKTAVITDNQDKLFPFYSAQVSIYGELLRVLGYGECDQLGIVYWQPRAAESIMQIYTDEEITASKGKVKAGDAAALCDSALWFDVVQKPVDPENIRSVPGWIAKAVAILDSDTPPKGKPGCKDCNAANALAYILAKGKAPLRECA